MYLWTCGSFSSANHKKIGSANRKSGKCHIFGRSANLTNISSRGRPPLHFTFEHMKICYKAHDVLLHEVKA
jgi:hypothetical protein